MNASALFTALAAYAATCNWQYVYPVWSRRAQGISIGINLHPNQCCNWQCVYCQVPGLRRGPSPVIQLDTLVRELEDCLQFLRGQLNGVDGQMSAFVQDIAFAGDGEPTTSPQFADAVQWVSDLLNHHPAKDNPLHVRLITNGSQLQHTQVQQAIRRLHTLNGEVWFKLDAGSDAEMQAINDSYLPLALHRQRLEICCDLCNTWVQTAIVNRRVNNGQFITTPSLAGYMQALQAVQDKVAGILLYGIARPSQQAAAASLLPVPETLLQAYANELRAQGYQVRAFT